MYLSHQRVDWDLLPFLPWPSLSPYSSSKQRLCLKRTIQSSLMIKGTMGFLGGPLGPKTGGPPSRLPNRPGYFGASQKQDCGVRTEDLAHLCVSAVVTHLLNSSFLVASQFQENQESGISMLTTLSPWKLLVVGGTWFLVVVTYGW